MAHNIFSEWHGRRQHKRYRPYAVAHTQTIETMNTFSLPMKSKAKAICEWMTLFNNQTVISDYLIDTAVSELCRDADFFINLNKLSSNLFAVGFGVEWMVP